MQMDLIYDSCSEFYQHYVLRIRYKDVDDKIGEISFSYYLSLVFAFSNNCWELILDQNTLIK